MTTYPPLTVDTLAVAIASSHYHDVVFNVTDARVDLATDVTARASDFAVDTHDALRDYIADDLSDYAHNANHAEYIPLFFPADDDMNDELIFRLFTSDDVINRVTTILLPLITPHM